VTVECSERGHNIVGSPHLHWHDFEAKGTGRCLSLLGLTHDHGIAAVGQYRTPAEAGNNVPQEFNPFADNIDALIRQARHVAARSR
jgi:hypothetical protein